MVAQLAPGVHTSSQCTIFVPNNGVRPRARGREYCIEIFVPSIICDMVPSSLARICASIGAGIHGMLTTAATSNRVTPA